MRNQQITEGEFDLTSGKNLALGLIEDLWISVLGPRPIVDDEWQQYGEMLVRSTKDRIKLRHALTIAGGQTPGGEQRRWMFEFLKKHDAINHGGITTIVTSSAPTLIALKGWNVVSLIMRLDVKHEPFGLDQLLNAISSCGIKGAGAVERVAGRTIEMVSAVGHSPGFVQALMLGSERAKTA